MRHTRRLSAAMCLALACGAPGEPGADASGETGSGAGSTESTSGDPPCPDDLSEDNANCGACGNVCEVQTLVTVDENGACQKLTRHGAGTCIDGACDPQWFTGCFRVAATIDESGGSPECVDSTGDYLSCEEACSAQGMTPCTSGLDPYENATTQHVYLTAEACSTVPDDCDPTLLGPYNPYPESLPLELIRRGDVAFDSYDPSACLLHHSAVYQENGGEYPAEIWQRCCCVTGGA